MGVCGSESNRRIKDINIILKEKKKDKGFFICPFCLSTTKIIHRIEYSDLVEDSYFEDGGDKQIAVPCGFGSSDWIDRPKTSEEGYVPAKYETRYEEIIYDFWTYDEKNNLFQLNNLSDKKKSKKFDKEHFSCEKCKKDFFLSKFIYCYLLLINQIK